MAYRQLMELDPKVMALLDKSSESYKDSMGEALLEVNDRKGGRETIELTYPIQGDKVMFSLMVFKGTCMSPTNIDRIELEAALRDFAEWRN